MINCFSIELEVQGRPPIIKSSSLHKVMIQGTCQQWSIIYLMRPRPPRTQCNLKVPKTTQNTWNIPEERDVLEDKNLLTQIVNQRKTWSTTHTSISVAATSKVTRWTFLWKESQNRTTCAIHLQNQKLNKFAPQRGYQNRYQSLKTLLNLEVLGRH